MKHIGGDTDGDPGGANMKVLLVINIKSFYLINLKILLHYRMPSIHFKDDSIEVKFINNDSFLSEIEEDYDIKMSMKEYANGTIEGSLKTNDTFINLFPAEKLLRFNVGDSSLDVNLTEYQVNKISGFFENGVYYELDVPESSSSLRNYDPPRNNINNNNDPSILAINSMTNSNIPTNNPITNGGKRSTRRRKTKHNKSKRKIRR